MKNYVASLFTFFKKSFAICKFLALGGYCLKFNPQYWYLLLRSEKICVDLVDILNKGREKTLQNRKSCVCIKYLTLVRLQKLIPVNFAVLYWMKNAQNSSIAKNYSFHNFFFASYQKKFFTSKNVYVMFIFTLWHLLEQYI